MMQTAERLQRDIHPTGAQVKWMRSIDRYNATVLRTRRDIRTDYYCSATVKDRFN